MVFRYYPATTASLIHIIPSFIQYKGQPFLSSPFISFHSIIIPLINGNCGNCCPLYLLLFVMPSQSLLLHRSPCLYSLQSSALIARLAIRKQGSVIFFAPFLKNLVRTTNTLFSFSHFIPLFLQSNFLVFSHTMSCHSLICALFLPTSYFVCTAFLRLL